MDKYLREEFEKIKQCTLKVSIHKRVLDKKELLNSLFYS